MAKAKEKATPAEAPEHLDADPGAPETVPTVEATEAVRAAETVVRLLKQAVPDAEWPRLAGGLAEGHQRASRLRRELTEMKAAHADACKAKAEAIAATLASMDPLAAKVRSRTFQGYVPCEVLDVDRARGVRVLRRTDTGDVFDEPLEAEGAQAGLLDEPAPPAAPPKAKGKLCRCPWHPGQVLRGETWHCPVEGHGHMWRRPTDDPDGRPVVETYPGPAGAPAEAPAAEPAEAPPGEPAEAPPGEPREGVRETGKGG